MVPMIRAERLNEIPQGLPKQLQTAAPLGPQTHARGHSPGPTVPVCTGEVFNPPEK